MEAAYGDERKVSKFRICSGGRICGNPIVDSVRRREESSDLGFWYKHLGG